MFRYYVEKYKPFEEVLDYYILRDNLKDIKYLIYNDCQSSYSLKIRKNGYIPKSGLIFTDIIKKNAFEKDILDLGTGELGIIGVNSLVFGANSVDTVDIDKVCVKWLSKLIKENKLKNIKAYKSNWFSKILKNKKYDIIFSNPPQMPMINGKKHDEGGLDGRKYIIAILKQSLKYLKENGELYILIFDFLGSMERTNKELSIKEIALNEGFKTVEKVKTTKKRIKENSVTFQNLNHIKEVYPLYKFNEDDIGQFFYIDILKFKK